MLEKNIKVSIIIPVYNAEKYIDKCICSVLGQTYRNIEVIIIDDGSTDESYNKIKEYAKNDKRINITRRENKGVYKTRIEGIEKSTGEYIMFVDSDDWIDNNMIENMISLIYKYQADICRCGIEFESEREKKERKVFNATEKEICIEKTLFKEKIYKKFITTYNFCSVDTQLIRKNKIELKKINTSLCFAEDLQFNLNLYTNVEKIVFTEKNYYHYTENKEGITKTYKMERLSKNLEDAIIVYSSLFEYLKIWDIDNEENKKVVANRILKEIATELIKLVRAEDKNAKQIYLKVKEVCKKDIINIIKQSIKKQDINDKSAFIKTIKKAIYKRNAKKIIFLMYLIYRPYIELKSKRMKK